MTNLVMNLRHCTLTFLFLLLARTTFSQVIEPVHWKVELSNSHPKVGEEIEVIFKGTIDDGWYYYSVDFEDCGPIPMSVEYEENAGFKLVGKLRAIGDHAKHDETFDCDVKIFNKTAEFRQTIKILSPDVTIAGSLSGQSCSELQGKCVPVGSDFSLAVVGEKKKPGRN